LYALLQAGLRIQGSIFPVRQVHRKMLEFAALHDVKSFIETFLMNVEGVESAFKKLAEGSMRYRAVLVA
jgi:D-arabinose 1-dehydrogenase-like Zn-dependent alcohol dehydrogenase